MSYLSLPILYSPETKSKLNKRELLLEASIGYGTLITDADHANPMEHKTPPKAYSSLFLSHAPSPLQSLFMRIACQVERLPSAISK